MQSQSRDNQCFLAVLMTLLMLLCPSCVKKSTDAGSSEHLIPDLTLERAIREALDIRGRALTESDLASLTTLEVVDEEGDQPEVRSLEGLQHCVNLVELNLMGNEVSDLSPISELPRLSSLILLFNDISDLSPLEHLTTLEILGLGDNEITDISPIGGLTKLENLGLGSNMIADISALANLTELRALDLKGNEVSDIDPLGDLVALERLSLSGNTIRDIEALSGLVTLEYLNLSGNQIEDIKPLVDNEGIDQGDELNLAFNPLNEVSVSRYLPLIERRGVELDVNTRHDYGLD